MNFGASVRHRADSPTLKQAGSIRPVPTVPRPLIRRRRYSIGIRKGDSFARLGSGNEIVEAGEILTG